MSNKSFPPPSPLICHNYDPRQLHLQIPVSILMAPHPRQEELSEKLKIATVNLSQRIISGEAIFCSTLLANC